VSVLLAYQCFWRSVLLAYQCTREREQVKQTLAW
jgi:hypothetical protein